MKLNIDDILNIIQNFISDNKIIIIIMISIIILSTLLVNIKSKKKKAKKSYPINHNDPLLSKDDIPNKEELQIKAFNLIRDLKTAKMHFDIDAIKTITTDNLFKLYTKQIETLKNKQQKNMIEQIKYIKSYITNNINNNENVNLRMVIECFDYIIDKNNKVIKGKYNRKMLQTYEIEIMMENSNYRIHKLELLYEREI